MKNQLGDREYKIVVLRYGLKDGISRTQHEVAEIMNISRSYISRIESKAKEILKEQFQEKNFSI